MCKQARALLLRLESSAAPKSSPMRKDLLGIAFGASLLGFMLTGWMPLALTGLANSGFVVTGAVGLGFMLAIDPAYRGVCELYDELKVQGAQHRRPPARGSQLGVSAGWEALGWLLLISLFVDPPGGTIVVFLAALIFFPVLWAVAVICGRFAMALVTDLVDTENREDSDAVRKD